MITWDCFLSLVIDTDVLGRRIDRDAGQYAAVSAAATESLFVVAGPGSGKTTALALRVLRLVFGQRLYYEPPHASLCTLPDRRIYPDSRRRVETFLAFGPADTGSA